MYCYLMAPNAELVDLPAQLRSEYGSKANELATIRQLMIQDFPEEEKLAQALQRQRQIESELDLDKDVAGSQAMATESV